MTACYARARCDTAGCPGYATGYCRYPVTRRGRTSTCNRRMCRACASAAQHCPPHARSGQEQLVKICTQCFASSCAHGELCCPSPGSTRLVTSAQWKTMLSFGVL